MADRKKEPVKKTNDKERAPVKKTAPVQKEVAPKAPPTPPKPVQEPPRPAPEPQKERKRFKLPKGLLSSIAVGIGVLAIGAIGLGIFGGGSATDSVSDDQRKEFESSQQTLLDNGGIQTRKLSTDRALQRVQDGAFGTMENAVLLALLDDIRKGAVEVRELQFYDNVAEDGDVIMVEANGVSHTVPLWHEPASMLFPYRTGQQNFARITAVKDGTGGVTLGVISDGGKVDLAPFAESQFFNYPLHE